MPEPDIQKRLNRDEDQKPGRPPRMAQEPKGAEGSARIARRPPTLPPANRYLARRPLPARRRTSAIRGGRAPALRGATARERKSKRPPGVAGGLRKALEP